MPTAPSHIFDSQPSTWQDLELLVEQAFAEMDYECKRGHELSTVRGKVKIDVYAVKHNTSIPTVVLCECKYWTKPVEQSVVYSFRSICGDVGAHLGLIISRAGFQSGANETREATNIHLLDFDAFQETFFNEWRTGIFGRFVQMTDVMMPLITTKFTSKDPALTERLVGVSPFLKYEMFLGGERSFREYFIFRNDLPVEIFDPRGNPHELKRITIRSFREYFEIGRQATADVRKYFGI